MFERAVLDRLPSAAPPVGGEVAAAACGLSVCAAGAGAPLPTREED